MKNIVSLLSIYLLLISLNAQGTGTQKQEYHLPLTIQECQNGGSCSPKSTKVTLDSNWRWTHSSNGYQNCYTGNQWDSNLCPNVAACTSNCVLEGVTSDDWSSPYGVHSTGDALTLNFVTNGPYSKNIGSRNYLLEDDENYYMFQLKNREFTFDVDLSNMPCGLNSALYFVGMEKDGGKSKYPTNKGGAKYGEGYCDAQCPHDIKWINGQANMLDWTPSPTDPNSGVGRYGSCCVEMDILEANQYDHAFTAHPCEKITQYQCEGVECGDNASGHRYDGVCDKDGCDFNGYRMGDHTFFGPGSSFKVDTTKPFTVVTQFLTNDNTDQGSLQEIKRLFIQNGKAIQNSNTNVQGLPQYNSLSVENCNKQKEVFAETNTFKSKGDFSAMDQAFAKGMVLVMSLWDDHEANMLWLDSDYPLDKDRSLPGVQRGPCSRDSGKPTDVESQYPNSSVKYSNIKIGAIGSTYQKEVYGFLEI